MYVTSQTTLPAEISCDWRALQAQLLSQWDRLTARELDNTMHNRRQIALLVEHKYGVHYRLVENYLRNFERTMPMAA